MTDGKRSEPEELQMLRHRWARTIEVWVAYQTFLQREVLIGPDHVCLNEIVTDQTTHTLLTVYYSFLYSLFDPSATNFPKITERLLQDLPAEAANVRRMILEHWETIRKPIAVIRSNIGFHGSPKEKGQKHGYDAYREIHPWASEYLMTSIRVFFRLLDETYKMKEKMIMTPDRADTLELLQMAKDMKAYMDATPAQGLMKQFAGFFEKVQTGEISLQKPNDGTVH